MQQEYLKLGMAVLKRSCHDLVRYSGARNRREYRSALRFLDSSLFGWICRGAGADPEKTRRLILWHARPARLRIRRPGRGVAEESPDYRSRA